MAENEKDLRIKELEEQIYCLKEIIKHVNEGVLLTDKNCIISEFNPAKEKMEQMKAQDVLGKLSWEAYSHSNKEISEHKKVFDQGLPILNAYRPHAYVGDIPVYIYYSTYPAIKNGEVVGVFTISRNETMLRELLYDTIEHKRNLRNKGDDKQKSLAKGTNFTFADIIGNSASIKKLVRDAQIISPMNIPVLITGETGTGKEVLAQSIHNLGRENKKFVAINCAAIPENLVESVLFGTVKGAYTGAVDSEGLLREAEDGTLFLDEINSMNTEMQAKLLRALQEQRVRPVGSHKEYPINCRLISASNECPELLIKEKRLRRDLFYRISGFCLSIPPLRNRKEDILDMADFFVQQYNNEFCKNIRFFSPEFAQWLVEKDWHGNTRELRNVIQNIMLCVSDITEGLTICDIPDYARISGQEEALKDVAGLPLFPEEGRNLNSELDRLQRIIIMEALKKHNNNITRAAAELGIGRQNLSSRMKRLFI